MTSEKQPFELIRGDCLDVLRGMAEASVDAIVTDPPYHLTANKKGGTGQASVNLNTPHGRARISTGFMGMKWDGGDVAFRVEVWVECLRVLKPGGHLLAFGSTRTYHRMATAIDDAGFEIRDMVAWLYGQGFPKGTDRSKIPAEWAGWNTALKPALEPICMARKPLDGTLAENLAGWGVGALWIDGCRIDTDDDLSGGAYADAGRRSVSPSLSPTGVGREFVPPPGRWPSNVLLDGSDEVLAAFPDATGQIADCSSSSSRKTRNVYGAMGRGNGRDGEASADSANKGAVGFRMRPGARRGDIGSAARFFFCAKAGKSDRNHGLPPAAANPHPTVKPTELMRYLVRLITPPGGLVLDPFAGSGSTGRATVLEGARFVGIDLDSDADGNPLGYIDIARARIAAALDRRRADAEPPRAAEQQLEIFATAT